MNHQSSHHDCCPTPVQLTLTILSDYEPCLICEALTNFDAQYQAYEDDLLSLLDPMLLDEPIIVGEPGSCNHSQGIHHICLRL